MPGYTGLDTREQNKVGKLSLDQQNVKATRLSTKKDRELTESSKEKDTNKRAPRKDKRHEISRQLHEAVEKLKDACLGVVDAIDAIDTKSTVKKDKPAEKKVSEKGRKLGRKVPT
jgi:hypothetical protein